MSPTPPRRAAHADRPRSRAAPAAAGQRGDRAERGHPAGPLTPGLPEVVRELAPPRPLRPSRRLTRCAVARRPGWDRPRRRTDSGATWSAGTTPGAAGCRRRPNRAASARSRRGPRARGLPVDLRAPAERDRPPGLQSRAPNSEHGVGDQAEGVRQGESGLLVSPGDVAALTRALERLLADPAEVRGQHRQRDADKPGHLAERVASSPVQVWPPLARVRSSS